MSVSAHVISLLKKNDRQAQTAFYEHHKKQLLGICRRYSRTLAEAEDVLQESFIKIFKQVHTLQNGESITAWAKSVTIRTAIDHYRQSAAERDFIGLDNLAELPTQDHDQILDKLTLDELALVISTLPDGYRAVFNLFFIDGYSHTEIGELLGIATGTSKSQLAKAKALFFRQLTFLGIVPYEL
jgi:RNA polymerase sigma-70 factor (ECF subfamily)